VLNVQSKVLHRWDDPRLKWNEDEHENIQMIHISSEFLWIPKIFINNSEHHSGLGTCHPTECIIKSSGQVGCWIPCYQTLECDTDYFDWPYDQHNCSIVFQTMQTKEDVEFDTNALGGIVVRRSNNEWRMKDVSGRVDPNVKTSISFKIILERFSDTIYMHVITPGLCLITLTVLILLINPESSWRLTLCGVNVYLHFNLMDRIWWQ
jgi:Neurotransmitter-gated ion-channel ligand binding domain